MGTYHDLVTGQYATAPTLSQRMIYRANGAAAYFEKTNPAQLLSVPLDLSTTDEVFAVMGARKNAVDGFDNLLVFNDNAAPGSFYFAQSGTNDDGWRFSSVGTLSPEKAEVLDGYPGGSKDLLSGQAKISAPSVSLRINGVLRASNTTVQGVGTYADDVLHIGGRENNASFSFQGDIFGLVLRDTLPTSQELSDTESFMTTQMGA